MHQGVVGGLGVFEEGGAVGAEGLRVEPGDEELEGSEGFGGEGDGLREAFGEGAGEGGGEEGGVVR